MRTDTKTIQTNYSADETQITQTRDWPYSENNFPLTSVENNNK